MLVMTHRNAPRMNSPAMFGSSPSAAAASDLPIMQDDRIHWNGQPIAIVLAETQEQADHAASLIRATYAAEPATTSFAAAKAAGANPASFMGEPLLNEIGDAEAALAAAPHKVDHVYRTPRHNHNAIELHAATRRWDGDELTIHDATQVVTARRGRSPQIFGLEREQVRVTSPYVGGGFGGKGLWRPPHPGRGGGQTDRRPVRVMLSREGVYRIVGGRTLTEQRVAIGAQADGHFERLIHTGIAAMTPHNNVPEPFITATRAALCRGQLQLAVETVADWTCSPTRSCARRAKSVGTFALEFGDRRIGDRARHGPDRTAHPQRAGEGSDLGPALLVAAHRRGLALGRRAVRLGSARHNTRRAARGRVADRHGLRDRDLSLYPDAGRRGADHSDARRTARSSRLPRTRWAWAPRRRTAIVAAERLGLPMDRVDGSPMATSIFPGASSPAGRSRPPRSAAR